jgi:hypothetical protein
VEIVSLCPVLRRAVEGQKPRRREFHRTLELNTVHFDFGFNCDTLSCS